MSRGSPGTLQAAWDARPAFEPFDPFDVALAARPAIRLVKP